MHVLYKIKFQTKTTSINNYLLFITLKFYIFFNTNVVIKFNKKNSMFGNFIEMFKNLIEMFKN